MLWKGPSMLCTRSASHADVQVLCIVNLLVVIAVGEIAVKHHIINGGAVQIESNSAYAAFLFV